MTREEAIERIKSRYDKWALDDKDLEAIASFVPELAESGDEKIKKNIIQFFRDASNGKTRVINSNSFAEWAEYLEKQKDASKAIEVVDRIDKYIDENVANAHDMKDSNPDKKYYRGWDDALGEMARILQDVYSNEKQKEQRDYNKLYEDIGKSEWFKKSYEGKSLGCNSEQEEQKPVEPIEFNNEFENQVSHLLASVLNGEHEYNEDFVRYAAQSLLGYAKKELKNAEQKPSETISQLTVQGKGVYKICPRCKARMIRDDSKAYTSIPPKYGYECPKCGEMAFDTVMYDSPEMEELKPAEWSEDDETRLKVIKEELEKYIMFKQYGTPLSVDDIGWLESLPERFNLQPKQEWSEEDDQVIGFIFDLLSDLVWRKDWAMSKEECLERLKSLKNRGNSPKNSTNSPSQEPSKPSLHKNNFDSECGTVADIDYWP